jgi:PIN domain nuclease of toxin-antitoxin system
MQSGGVHVADRLIYATAVEHGLLLVTKDGTLRGYAIHPLAQDVR